MIVSASRRTDIPAFYGQWFMRRVREGFFYTANPFNAKQVTRYNLTPETVDFIVFWTKNPAPFEECLGELLRRGFHFYFQFTLNDYPEVFEPCLPPVSERLATFRRLSRRLGSDAVLWRYDPIIISSVTPAEYHAERIADLAGQLEGHTERLTISFLDFYRKVSDRLSRVEEAYNIQFTDIARPEHFDSLTGLCREIGRIAHLHGMRALTCGEAVDVSNTGIEHGACIDPSIAASWGGCPPAYQKDPGQRSECLCTESVDLGLYNTCPHGCTYCYANTSDRAVRNAFSKHDPDSPLLIARLHSEATVRRAERPPTVLRQARSLLDGPDSLGD